MHCDCKNAVHRGGSNSTLQAQGTHPPGSDISTMGLNTDTRQIQRCPTPISFWHLTSIPNRLRVIRDLNTIRYMLHVIFGLRQTSKTGNNSTNRKNAHCFLRESNVCQPFIFIQSEAIKNFPSLLKGESEIRPLGAARPEMTSPFDFPTPILYIGCPTKFYVWLLPFKSYTMLLIWQEN